MLRAKQNISVAHHFVRTLYQHFSPILVHTLLLIPDFCQLVLLGSQGNLVEKETSFYNVKRN